MNLTPNPTAEQYRDAAHYWQTQFAATETRLIATQEELINARTEIARLVEIAYGSGPKPPVTSEHPETLAAFADMMAPKGGA